MASPGKGYVYDTRTGATVATYQFASPPATVINDVALTTDGAWFTDSAQAKLYFVPVSAAGVPGPFSTLALSGPAADTSGEFNLNGIQATPDGKTLDRGALGQRRALHGRSGQRCQRDHRRGERAERRRHRAPGQTAVGGAELATR